MADAPSTLTAWRVGGQLDPAWLTDVAGLAGRTWTSIRATATLVRPTNSTVVVDPSNGAHEHPLVVSETLDLGTVDGAPSDGQWRTAPLKATTAVDADDALQPSGLAWRIDVGVRRSSGGTFATVYTHTVAISADRDYVGLGETITVDGVECIDVNALIPVPITTPASDAFTANVVEVLEDRSIYGDGFPVAKYGTLAAAIAAAKAAGGGRVVVGSTPVTVAAPIDAGDLADVPLLIDARGAHITYTGGGAMLSAHHTSTHPTHAKQAIEGGVWVGSATATEAVALTDISGFRVEAAQFVDWPAATIIRLTNASFWCEATTIRDVQAADFHRFLQMDGNPSGSASFARTKVLGCQASDRGSADYWVYGNDTCGPYDSVFEIHGNAGANLVAVFRVRAGWGMTRLRSKVEQNTTPTGAPAALIDTDGNGGQPELDDVDWRSGMTLTTSGFTARDLTPVRFDSGIRVGLNGVDQHILEPDRLKFFGAATLYTQRAVTGSTDTAKLASLIAALAQYGLISDQTT